MNSKDIEGKVKLAAFEILKDELSLFEHTELPNNYEPDNLTLIQLIMHLEEDLETDFDDTILECTTLDSLIAHLVTVLD